MLVARQWLEGFAKRCQITYDQVTKAAIKYRDTGEYTGSGNNFEPSNQLAGFISDDNLDGDSGEMLEEFWKQIEIVFGVSVEMGRRLDPFMCCQYGDGIDDDNDPW